MSSLFDTLLEKAKTFQSNTISEASKSTYQTYLKLYETTMEKLNEDPYPIQIDKMMVFIQFQKDSGLEYNSLKSCISSLSFYFRSNSLDNLTYDIRFINFHKGVLRDMKYHRDPNRKLPWDPKFFSAYLLHYPLNQLYNTQFLFFMSISYYGFLRISELQHLKKEDISIEEDHQRLKLFIRYSKTDQNGEGETTYIYNNDKDYSPYKLFTLIKDSFADGNYIVSCSGAALRQHLKVVLKQLCINPNDFSWHSFRRGGAHQAALLGIQDCDIKKHGRWKSEAYMRYVDVNPEFAGASITNKI